VGGSFVQAEYVVWIERVSPLEIVLAKDIQTQPHHV
jgi:hypothetical protein